MFLDVACFLIGETESTAVAAWDGMKLRGTHGLQTLVNKCLVELDFHPEYWNEINIFNEQEIRMHDHLRDMGREIASTQSSYRLWWPEQIKKTDFKKEMPIRGIRPPPTFQAFKEYKQQLLGISNGLRLLHVEGNEFTEEFASLLLDIVCLRCDNFPLKNIPPWVTSRPLSVLQLYNAPELEELWEDNVDPPLELRKLIITYPFGIQRFPTSIRRLQYLKMISIAFGGSSLPEEFCCLLSLEYLHLLCPELHSLPAGFGNLINLKCIRLFYCTELSTLPDSFKLLIHLEHLHLTDCAKLKLKLDAFENIRKLKILRLMKCKELEELPDSKQLIHLEDLCISCSMVSTLPDGFGNLTSLRRINLESNSILGRLPDCFGQLIRLETLNLSSCKSLYSLPAGFGKLVNLKHIDLRYCSELSTLPDSFKHLIHLEHHDLGYCAKLKLKLNAFENIRKLNILKLDVCEELEDLPNEIVNQACLRQLDLRGCIKLRGSPTNIGQLVNLQWLTIESQILGSLQTGVVTFSSLKDINIVSCVDAEEEECKPVSRVSITNDCFPKLQEFILNQWFLGKNDRHIMEIETLPSSLKTLKISRCKVLKKMRCLTGLASLEELFIEDCPLLEEMSSFCDLVSLESFCMVDCPKVQKIGYLHHCKSLKRLCLINTPSIMKELCLQNVEGLELLEVECESISAVKECPQDMCIQGWVSRTVEAIVDSLNFPDLVLREVKRPNNIDEIRKSLNHSVDFLYYEEGKEKNEQRRKMVRINVHFANATNRLLLWPMRDIERAVEMRGRRERVVDAFDQLLSLFE